ncbi:MAG: endonuclease MutS2 [Proteocatella sp.]
MNELTFEKLQFDELKELIKIHCVSSTGKKLIEKLKPSADINIVKRRLAENREARKIIEYTDHIPLEGIYDIMPLLDKTEKGMVLDASELVRIEDFLRGCSKIKTFMADKEFYSPTLSSYALNISQCQNIEEEIRYSIKGNRVNPEASKTLKKIKRNIETTEGKIKDRLNKFIMSSENKKYIQEFIISKRNDRYVIPIIASYKNEVPGVILDTSSKENTVFIEPGCISRHSLELIGLQSDEIIEEYKILSYLTGLIYEEIRSIRINMEIISEYDMVFAKAKFSYDNGGITPKLNSRGYINIINGKHPLLPKSEAVPMNFEIGTAYRGIVITGPNAGGKTVVLKTVGLLTLMVQSGLDIFADEGTQMSVFEKIFVDIGDNQSIENALSTFSSHIKNIADIMKLSNSSTLVLLDEIGSGTEPNEGAALAIAILEEFYRLGCVIVASTHYSEIKKFAHSHPEFENAGMLFDKNTLEPMYKLTIGSSQSSNALFISQKMGIKEAVLKKAEDYMNDKNYNYEIVKKSNPAEKKEREDSLLEIPIYDIGDKVQMMENEEFAIVYKQADKFNNLKLLYKGQFVEINVKRIKLYLKASELYPNDYDFNTLFESYESLKLERDITRGSKKALKKIQKEIKTVKEAREN